MELDELAGRLVPFARAKYADERAGVCEVHKMPGHAGFAYGFTVESRGARESWFLRIPPPGVQWRGTADVLRQVCVLNALDSRALRLLDHPAIACPDASLRITLGGGLDGRLRYNGPT
jgi:hypothetical protein